MTIETASASRIRKDGSFFDTSRTLRFVILLLITLGTFFFLHNREIRVPMLELGTIAPRYIVAEVSFSFADEEATAAARQAALFDIGNIYFIHFHLRFERVKISDNYWRR